MPQTPVCPQRSPWVVSGTAAGDPRPRSNSSTCEAALYDIRVLGQLYSAVLLVGGRFGFSMTSSVCGGTRFRYRAGRMVQFGVHPNGVEMLARLGSPRSQDRCSTELPLGQDQV